MPSAASGPSIVIVPGSRRTGSLNVALGHRVAGVGREFGWTTTVVDMDDYSMPLYDGDVEDEAGVPDGARRLHDLLVEADLVVFVSPEYNGGPTPLLKNAIDWVTRVSKRPLEGKPVGLMSATPGSGGGAVGLGVMTAIMRSLRVDLFDRTLSVGNARVRLSVDDRDLDDEIGRFLEGFGAAVRRKQISLTGRR